MADIVTGTTTGFVNNTQDATLQNVTDLRRETALDTAAVTAAVNDANYNSSIRNEQSFDRLGSSVAMNDSKTADRFFTVARDTSDLRAQVTAVGYQVRDGFFSSAKDAELNALKTQMEMAKQTTYLSDKIGNEGEKTRNLVAELQTADLNRRLIERNAELTEARHDGRYWRGHAEQGQFAAVSTAIQALGSSLQETRQGLVNFGSMSGGAGQQTSTSNSVR